MTILLCIGTAGGCRSRQKLVVPQGYMGWIRVEFGVPGAPPLPRKSGLYEIRVPPIGRLRTSTPLPGRISADPEVYRADYGTSLMQRPDEKAQVWGNLEYGLAPALVAFVGTSEQYNRLAIKTLAGRRVGPLDPRWAERRNRFPIAAMAGATLRGANLAAENLLQFDFSRADLAYADLSSAGLIKADLHGSNLAGSNLSHADLFEAQLQDADLTGADLTAARLEGANLTGAILRRAKLCAVLYDDATLWPKGFRPKVHGAVKVMNQPGHSNLRVLIPKGYEGALRVDFGVDSAPPLLVEPDGYYLLKMPPNGQAKTSTPNDFEYGRPTEFYYYDPEGRQKLTVNRQVHIVGSGGGSNENYVEYVIGSEAKYPR